MSDVVVFAGPIILKPEFAAINWLGRDVRIVPIVGAGSANFTKLGEKLRGQSGRILPNLLDKYARGIEKIDSLSLCAYSAGNGLLNQIGMHEDDMQAVKAVVLNDAAFVGNNRPTPAGLTNWATRGARGDSLFVATSSRGKGETYRNGTESVAAIWYAAESLSHAGTKPVQPSNPVTQGTWQQLGVSAYWGDIPTLTHGEHHDYAPVVWQAYLAPYLAAQSSPSVPMSGYGKMRR